MKQFFLNFRKFLRRKFYAFQSSEIEIIIDTMLQNSCYSGVILASHPQLHFHKAYNPSSEKIITEESLFPIASITKTLTSSLVLLELEKRKISLDIPVKEAISLPFYVAPYITFSDLLAHRSGIGLYTDFTVYDPRRSTPLPREEFLKLISTSTTKHGEFSYNNGNYILLEMILETMTCKPFQKLLQDAVLTPLTMVHTGLIDKTQQIPLVYGYTKQKGLALPLDYSWLGGGAGLYSTASDLYKFASAFMHGKVLPKKLMTRAWSEHSVLYGYGWSLGYLCGKKVFFHEGGIDGFSTMLMLEPLTFSLLILLSNCEIEIEPLAKKIFSLLLSKSK